MADLRKSIGQTIIYANIKTDTHKEKSTELFRSSKNTNRCLKHRNFKIADILVLPFKLLYIIIGSQKFQFTYTTETTNGTIVRFSRRMFKKVMWVFVLNLLKKKCKILVVPYIFIIFIPYSQFCQ